MGILISGGIALAQRLIGGHLIKGSALSAVNGVEGAVSGLGWRFFVGAGAALYWTQPTVRDAIDNLFVAIKGTIL